MRINGVNKTAQSPGQAGMVQKEDAVSKSIRKQIANKQKELQNLSSNQEMEMEEKSKKRQEIMQEINDLNNQLRQHQMEQRREAMNAERKQEKGASADDFGGSSRKSGTKGTGGMSKAGMKAMISADAALSQAQVQGSTATGMENRAAILKTEIKLDSSRGADVSKKKEELAEVEDKAAKAEASQLGTLNSANEELKKAQEAGPDEEKDKNSEKADREQEEKEKAEHMPQYPSINIYL